MAVGRRLHAVRTADQVFDVVRADRVVRIELRITLLVIFEVRAHGRVVEEIGGQERVAAVLDESAVVCVVVARGERVSVRQFVGVDRPHDLLHPRLVVGHHAGRRLDQDPGVEVGREADADVERRALRHHPCGIVVVARRDVLGVKTSADVVPPAGILVVDRDGEREIIAQQLEFAAVSRDRILSRGREAHLHLAVVAALVLNARDDLGLIRRGEQIVAPVVDAGGDEHRQSVLPFGVARDAGKIHRVQVVLDRQDRRIPRDLVPGQPVIERQRLDLVEDVGREVVVSRRSRQFPGGRIVDRLQIQFGGGDVAGVVDGRPDRFDFVPVEHYAGMPLQRDRRGGVGRAEVGGHAAEVGAERADLLLDGIDPRVVIGKRHGRRDDALPAERAEFLDLTVGRRGRRGDQPFRGARRIVGGGVDRDHFALLRLAVGAIVDAEPGLGASRGDRDPPGIAPDVPAGLFGFRCAADRAGVFDLAFGLLIGVGIAAAFPDDAPLVPDVFVFARGGGFVAVRPVGRHIAGREQRGAKAEAQEQRKDHKNSFHFVPSLDRTRQTPTVP